MSDLVAFLRARLDEDEQAALAAAPGPWSYGDIDSVAGGTLYDPTVAIASVDWDSKPGDQRIRRDRPATEADATGAHIARHDPARVLREVAAKRAIIERYAEEENGLAYCSLAGDWEQDEYSRTVHALLPAVHALAAVYADHDECDPAWAPGSGSVS